MREREKLQKYFDLLAFKSNLNHSDLRKTVGAMIIRRRELFSGSPGMFQDRREICQKRPGCSFYFLVQILGKSIKTLGLCKNPAP